MGAGDHEGLNVPRATSVGTPRRGIDSTMAASSSSVPAQLQHPSQAQVRKRASGRMRVQDENSGYGAVVGVGSAGVNSSLGAVDVGSGGASELTVTPSRGSFSIHIFL